tara:strand:+ start:937 stop:2187 length:1251 start_codon:yes stop_codon:yes gene_type:complete
MKKVLNLSDYLKFTPLLLTYFLISLIKFHDILIGDEDDYLRYADNLLKGFYANDNPQHDYLWYGPGYPIFLAIFRFFNCNLLIPKLFNCLFIYFGNVMFFKSLKKIIPEIQAIFLTSAVGLYYPFLAFSIPSLLTEALSYFLICSLILNFSLFILNNNKKRMWIAVISLGYLALTKIIFAYVIMMLFIIFIPFLMFKKTYKVFKKYILLLFLSFCLTTPYLVYTHSLTGKLLYFGDSGGMSLYWMSTPYKGEFGDWHPFTSLETKPKIYKNHAMFVNTIKNLHPVEKDIALKKKAIQNIKNNKFKFFKNWQYNLSRLFFNRPYSAYNEPRYSFVIDYLFNGILLFLFIATIFLNFKNIKKISPLFYFLGTFVLVYLGGISLLSCYPRFLHILFPVIIMWTSYTINEFVNLKFKYKD